jgi:hypothetical protein
MVISFIEEKGLLLSLEYQMPHPSLRAWALDTNYNKGKLIFRDKAVKSLILEYVKDLPSVYFKGKKLPHKFCLQRYYNAFGVGGVLAYASIVLLLIPKLE